MAKSIKDDFGKRWATPGDVVPVRLPITKFRFEPKMVVGSKLIRFSFCFSAQLLKTQLTDMKTLKRNKAGEVLVRNVRIDDGLQLYCEGEPLGYKPDEFDSFLSALGLPSNITAEGLAAVKLFHLYKKWEANYNAKLYVDWLRAGKVAFEDIREHHPALLEHPIIKTELARLYKNDALPKRRKGKRAKFDPCGWELFQIARYIYYTADESMNWTQACGLAIDENPDLVPKTWREDSLASLKKISKKTRKALRSIR